MGPGSFHASLARDRKTACGASASERWWWRSGAAAPPSSAGGSAASTIPSTAGSSTARETLGAFAPPPKAGSATAPAAAGTSAEGAPALAAAGALQSSGEDGGGGSQDTSTSSLSASGELVSALPLLVRLQLGVSKHTHALGFCFILDRATVRTLKSHVPTTHGRYLDRIVPIGQSGATISGFVNVFYCFI